MKKIIAGLAAFTLIAAVGAANAQTGMKNNAEKKNEPNMMAPSAKNSQRPGTAARPDEAGTGGTGNASAQSGQSGGSASGGTTGSNAGGPAK